MDDSVRIAKFSVGSSDEPFQFTAFVPLDETAIRFDAACEAIRNDWDKRDLGFKIRSMHAVSTQVSKETGIARTMPFYVCATKNNSTVPAIFMPDYGASFFDAGFLSAEFVVRTVPHESYHFCQHQMKILSRLSPNLFPERYHDKVPEWFGAEYISALGDDYLGYRSQPIEFDTSEFTYNFLKKHNLSSDLAKLDYDSAIESRDPMTREIVADYKSHLKKLASISDAGGRHFGAFMPGGHSLGAISDGGEIICSQIEARRRDSMLKDNAGLSNIMGHLAFLFAPKDVSLLLPDKNLAKNFNDMPPAIDTGDDILLNPKFLMESQSAQEYVDNIAKAFGVAKPKVIDVLNRMRKPQPPPFDGWVPGHAFKR